MKVNDRDGPKLIPFDRGSGVLGSSLGQDYRALPKKQARRSYKDVNTIGLGCYHKRAMRYDD